MEAITFLTLNIVLIAFLYFAHQERFVYDFVFTAFSAIMAFFIALTLNTFGQFTAGGNVFLILIYSVYGLSTLVYSIVMLLEAMEKGI